MKVKVTRLLASGQYRIGFEVGSFSAEEADKMNKFGVPNIPMKMVVGGSMTNRSVGINQINANLFASFSSQKDASDYEESVLAALRNAIDSVRSRNDTFSGSDEVDI